MKMSYDEINDDYDRYSPLQINETDFDPLGEQPGLVKYLLIGVPNYHFFN